MDASDVTACIVTRGDVPLREILASLIFDKVIIWDNSAKDIDQGAFGRYLAAERAEGVVYFQDDDCVVKPEDQQRLVDAYKPGQLAALMPPSRTDYTDTVLIGWGSICDWTLPYAAFLRWQRAGHDIFSDEFKIVGADFVFPMLTPYVRLDAEHEDLPHAYDTTVRTFWTWPDYAVVKERYLREARKLGRQ